MDERDVEANDERRPLTIVFSDLVRSTSLSATIDDEDFIVIIERYYAIAEEVFTSHGGYIAEHIGDGVFVWFGYPVAREGDADRAVAAGIELIERIREAGAALERKFGDHIDARVGIHSGSVVVRTLAGGWRQRIRLRRQLRGEGAGGRADWRRASQRGDAGVLAGVPRGSARGDIAIAGAEGTIHLFHVVGATPHPAPMLLSASPLVGRDQECARLVSSWEDARRAGSTVVLAGTAGIGKTRPRARGGARVAEREGRVVWLRCDRYHESVSFWPVHGAVPSLWQALRRPTAVRGPRPGCNACSRSSSPRPRRR